MTWVDYAIVTLLLFSILIGLIRGFIKETLSLVTWGGALWLAYTFYEQGSGLFKPYIQAEQIRSLCAFFVIFIMVLIIGSMVNYLFATLVKKSGLSGTDRILGILFGLGRGVIITSLLLLVTSFTSFKTQTWWGSSKLIPQFQPMMSWMTTFIPSEIKHMDKINKVTIAQNEVLALGKDNTSINLSTLE